MTIRAPLITRIEPRAPLLQEFSSPGRVKDLLKGKDKQFAGAGQWKAYDWPNPTLRKDAAYLQAAVRSESDVWSNRLLDLLKGKDKQFRGPGQWTSYDWPNPIGRTWRYIDPSYVNDLLPVPLAPVVFRKFLFQPTVFISPPVVQYEFYQNLLATTLRADYLPRQPAYAPYRTVRVITDDPVPNLLTTTLVPAVAGTPFSQGYWPNPLGPSYRDTSFIQDLNLQLLGQDQFFGAPGQGPALDWPNPRGASRSSAVDLNWVNAILPIPAGSVVFRKQTFQRTLYIPRPDIQHEFYQNVLLTTLGTPSAAPFSQENWPNPIGSAFPQDLRGYIQDLNLELIGQDKFFGAPGQGPANLDWPVPKGAVGSVDLRTWIVNLSQGTLAPAFVQPPFTFTDWKNPWAAGFPLDLRSFLDANRLNNPIPPALPVAVGEPFVGGGASGAKRYRQPAWWGDEKKRKLEKKVEAVQKLIEKKREQIDFAPDLLRMQRLIEQLQELQKRLMKLLEQIDALNKEAEDEEALRIYLIYRSLH